MKASSVRQSETQPQGQARRLNTSSSIASLSSAERKRARSLFSEHVVWNACDSTPEEHADREYINKIKNSAVTAINHTVAYSVNFKQAVKAIATWTRLYEQHPEVGFIARD